MNLDRLSEKIAKELKLSEAQVKTINRIQYKFLLEEMQSGDFNSVQLIYIGKYHKNKKYGSRTTRTDIRGMEEPGIQEQTS